MKKYPKFCVVILNRNGGGQLKKCLGGVFMNDYPNFEAIVVDNGSDDGSFESAKKDFSKASFVRNEANIGYAAANNIGIKFALERAADFVLLVQSKMEIGKDFLAGMAEEAEKGNIAVAGPVILRSGGKEIVFAGGKINWLKNDCAIKEEIRKGQRPKTQFVPSAAMMVKAEVFKKIGLMSEDFFMFFEDMDFSLRARKEGFPLAVFPEVKAYCTAEKQNAEEIYWKTVSALVFFKRHTPAVLRVISAPVLWAKKMKILTQAFFLKDEEAKIKRKALRDFKKVEKKS